MYDPTDQTIPVATIFGDTYKAVHPFCIRWEDKDYTIVLVGYRHKYRKGKSFVHVFSATDGLNVFELLFDGSDIRWMLGRLQMQLPAIHE